jgi:HK97 family phage major capsid protein
VPYDNVISRTDVAARIPEQVSDQMLTNLQASSAVLDLGTRIQIAATQVRFPVLSALPTAYFVNGDTGQKQTTEAAWANKYINVEELAAIVPIPENVFDDTSFDVWGAIRPLLENAISRSLDAAVFFATNKPTSWDLSPATTDATMGLVAAAVAAGNTITRTTNAAAAGGIAGDLSDLIGTLEADGYMPNGAVANTTLRGRIRQNRATTGESLGEISLNDWYGANVAYNLPGLWPTGSGAAEALVGDFSNLVVGVRKDFTYKVLDQAVIQDNTGAIVFNLPQQDMVALRVTFRVGVAVANPINYQQGTEANRYPFGVLRAP